MSIVERIYESLLAYRYKHRDCPSHLVIYLGREEHYKLLSVLDLQYRVTRNSEGKFFNQYKLLQADTNNYLAIGEVNGK